MIVFPNCKINLGLHIVRKRADGYHDLETIFYPVPYHDMLEFVPSGSFQFTSTGLTISGDPGRNLCVRAYTLLQQLFPKLPPVHMHLHKIIPMGAGLGGGSANGSFALMALDNHFKLGLSQEQLIQLSLELGSDCPFFIVNTPVLAKGRGEMMEPITLSLEGYQLVLIHPGIHVSTAEAFAGIQPSDSAYDLVSIISGTPDTWKDRLHNQFEDTVFVKYPAVAELKKMLYDKGALYASMTGSGSAVYGIFRSDPAIDIDPAWKFISVALK